MQNPPPSAEFEVSHPDCDSLDDDDEIVYPAEANDVFNPTTVKSIWDKLNEITPLEACQQWPSKAKRKTTTNNDPRYDNEVTLYMLKVIVFSGNFVENLAPSPRVSSRTYN